MCTVAVGTEEGERKEPEERREGEGKEDTRLDRVGKEEGERRGRTDRRQRGTNRREKAQRRWAQRGEEGRGGGVGAPVWSPSSFPCH